MIGSVGDCWFLSALGAVATKTRLLEKLCVAVRSFVADAEILTDNMKQRDEAVSIA